MKGELTHIEIDDTEPVDRLAGELSAFASALQKMTAAQAKELSKMLKLLLKAVDRKQELTVALPEPRPRNFEVTVTSRDNSRFIKTVRILEE